MVEQALPIVKGYYYPLRVTATGGEAAAFPEGSKIRAQVRDYVQSVNLRAELTFENGGLRRVSADTIDMVISEAETAAIRNSSVVVEFSRTDVAPKAYLYLMLKIPVSSGKFYVPVEVEVKPALAVSLSTPPTFYGGLAGAATGSCTATGALSVVTGVLLAGSALGSGSASGTLVAAQAGVTLAGNATGTGSGSGTLAAQVTALLAGSAVGSGSGTGTLLVDTTTYLPTVASAPVLSLGMSKHSPGYNGQAVNVARLSPAGTQDIGFTSDTRKLDIAAAAAYQGASSITDAIWYDQSGSLRNALQATSALQPVQWIGTGGASINNFTVARPLVIPDTVSVDRQNCTVFMVARTPSNSSPVGFWELGAAGEFGLRSYSSAYANQPVVEAVIVPPTAAPSGGAHTSITKLSIIATVSSPSGIKQHRDDQVLAFPAAAAKTLVGGRIGTTAGVANGRFDLVAFIVYPTALSDADVASVKAALQAIYPTQLPATRAILMDGDSITFGTGAVNNRTISKEVGLLLGRSIEIRNIGVAGTQISANKNKWDTAPLRFTVPGVQNVLRFHMGRNDIANGATASQVIADVKTYMTAVRAQGVAEFVIGTTALPNVPGGWTSAMETERLAYNTWLRSNPTDNNGIQIFNALDDLAAHPVIGDGPTYDGTLSHGAYDTALYPDNLHPSELAIATYMAPSFLDAYNAMVPTPLSISATPVTTANQNTAYAGFAVTSRYGTAPYTYSLASGTLPTGMTLNTATGSPQGTPTAVETKTGIVIRVTDSVGATANLPAFQIAVANPQQVVVDTITQSSTTTDSTAFNILLPPTINAGDLLVVGMSVDANPVVTWDNTTAGTWVASFNDVQTANRLVVYTKVADGTEDGKTLAVTVANAQQCAAFAIRCTAAQGTVAVSATGNRGTGTSADPGAVTAPWGVANNLFLQFLSVDNYSGANPTPPTGYGNLTFLNTSASGQTGLALAYKSASAASDDAAAWALAVSAGYIAASVAVRPS